MPISSHHRCHCSALRSGLALVGSVLSALALAPLAHADATDVSLLNVDKVQLYQQTSPAAPVLKANPFTCMLGADASRPGSIQSAIVQKPNNALSVLSSDGQGNFFEKGRTFANLAALNFSYPNGSYAFSLDTVTAPASYSNSVPINGDFYPTTIPRITSGTWASGGLQVDPAQSYFLSWQLFSTSFSNANSGVIFQVVDASDKLVFGVSLTKDNSSTSIPASILQPGQYYTASLIFQNKQFAFVKNPVTGVATYAARTDFKIATIGAPPALSGPSTSLGTVGQMFVYQIIATNHPFNYGTTALPPGLTVNSSLGIISGIPTTPGTTQVTLSATNIDGVGSKGFAPTIQAAPSSGPVIISSTSALYYSGKPFTFQVVTKGATPAARITATGLPTGLSLDPITGIISGTTGAVGSFPINLTVRDGNFTALGFIQLTFTADGAYPVITNADKVTVPRGQLFSYTVDTPGASDPADPPVYTMIGILPQGLLFNAATGTISGTYSGPLLSNNTYHDPSDNGGDPPNVRELSGGALLGSIQLFGTNSHGTSTFQLLFLAPPSGAVNISTRLFVGTGENVLIGGFIVTGNAPKVVIIRGIGPSLGIPNALQDPVLELHNGATTIVNDNWRTGTPNQEQIIKDTTIPPPNDRESAIVVALDPGNYTAIVSGKNGATGIALVEVYDLGTASVDPASKAQLAQISSRGNVLTGDNVMIGGFIVSGVTTKIIVRAIGPSLSAFGIGNALPDTILELHDSNGTTFSNDDWRSDQEQEIINTTVPPTDNRESAIVRSLVPGGYTAIVRGKGNATGVALVEVYTLQ